MRLDEVVPLEALCAGEAYRGGTRISNESGLVNQGGGHRVLNRPRRTQGSAARSLATSPRQICPPAKLLPP